MNATRDILLDTGPIIGVARSSELGIAIEERHSIRQRQFRPFISVVSAGECLAVAKRNGWGSAKTKELLELIGNLTIVDIHNGKILHLYAEIDAALQKAGKKIDGNDKWIAACASATGALLITTDRDFEPLDPDFLKHERYNPRTGAMLHGA